MNESFCFEANNFEPLAARMRPKTLEEYIGQTHILEKALPLFQAIDSGKLHSMILWGPSGTGKTTLAELMAAQSQLHVEKISAVTSGMKDIRLAIEQARQYKTQGKQTLLFVDEVHRFNKIQQDAFLPYIEDGSFIFVGATTENPSFEINSALLSRVKTYVLKALSQEDITSILQRALTCYDKGLGAKELQIEPCALEAIAHYAHGDARNALNLLELVAKQMSAKDVITVEVLHRAMPYQSGLGGKNNDHFYDFISAFHKSIRGSSPDAALYWLARMLESGVDPLYPARRLLAIASEDIGNADPQAMTVALNAWNCFKAVGEAEGERAIAQAAVYLACAPKSNAVYTAFNQAQQLAKETNHEPVPLHLRNAPTELMAELGYGNEYRYAHHEPQSFAAGENYFPENLKDTQLYRPTTHGFEKRIHEKLAKLEQFNQASDKKRYETS